MHAEIIGHTQGVGGPSGIAWDETTREVYVEVKLSTFPKPLWQLKGKASTKEEAIKVAKDFWRSIGVFQG